MPKTTKGSRRHRKSKPKTKTKQKHSRKYSRRQKKQLGGAEHMDTIPISLKKRQEIYRKKLQEKLRLRQQSLQAQAQAQVTVPLSLALQEQIKKRLFGNSGK